MGFSFASRLSPPLDRAYTGRIAIGRERILLLDAFEV